MSGQEKSEDILGQRADRCISDLIIKTGAGISVGIIFSVLFAKRRSWPVVFGTGFGLGCKIDQNSKVNEREII
ncbi:MICOS complex subunit MIC10 [Sparganum proliferum]